VGGRGANEGAVDIGQQRRVLELKLRKQLGVRQQLLLRPRLVDAHWPPHPTRMTTSAHTLALSVRLGRHGGCAGRTFVGAGADGHGRKRETADLVVLVEGVVVAVAVDERHVIGRHGAVQVVPVDASKEGMCAHLVRPTRAQALGRVGLYMPYPATGRSAACGMRGWAGSRARRMPPTSSSRKMRSHAAGDILSGCGIARFRILDTTVWRRAHA
jgi:hypothetical protein